MPRPDKKSESLEIRIPYATKAAFMERCRAEGTSASQTLREFIEAHLTGSTATPRAQMARPRRWIRVGAGAAAALGLAATAVPSLARPLERAEFERLDRDRDGALVSAEFARSTAVRVEIGGAQGLTSIGRPALRLEADGADAGLREMILSAAFRRLDRDANGALSFAEFRRP